MKQWTGRTVALAAGLAGMAAAAQVQAAISYTSAGANYTQNFDSLPKTNPNANNQANAIWIDDTASPTGTQVSIPGWYLYHPVTQASEGGTNEHQRLRVSQGNTTTGSFYSFGATVSDPVANADRALGMISSDTMALRPGEGAGRDPNSNGESYYGFRITNNTDRTLTSFTLSYTGEQWRNGGSGVQSPITLAYSLNATAIQAGTFTSVGNGGFGMPQTAAAAAVLNGNLSANRVAVTTTVTDITWAQGTDLWVRWADVNDYADAGATQVADHGAGIDDLTFSATGPIPEPSSALAVLGLGALLLRRRA